VDAEYHNTKRQHSTGTSGFPNAGEKATLSNKHRRTLEVGSAILGEVLKENDVRTITHGRELPEGFSRRQRRRGGGILFAVARPNRETSYSFRPDDPDPENPGHKYEQPCKALGAAGNVLGIPADQRQLVDDASVPVILVEGIKKMLSVVSAARRESAVVLVVAISGVWNWLSNGKPIADMLDIPMDGRRVTICFDSDMLRNPSVQDAAHQLAEHLLGRGAEVFISYLRDQDDGSKTGADDFLAAGGTLAELRMLTRRYDPADFVRVRLSRSEKLRAAISSLWRDWYERDWMHFVGNAERGNWARGHTARDVKEAFIELAMRGGKQDERGIMVTVGLRMLAGMSAKSHESARKAVVHLEADGQLEIIPAVDREKPRSYRLLVECAAARARVDSMEGGTETERRLRASDPRCQPLRVPTARRLRWSSPARKVQRLRGVAPDTRRVRQTRRFHKDITVAESMDLFPDRPYVKRLGPHRCAVLDALEAAGGELHLDELCEVSHRKRPRDVRRRILPMLEEAKIIECEGDVIRLAADWLEKLEEERERKEEVSHAEEQREKHRKQRERYRDYLKSVKQLPSKASEEAVKRGHESREAGLAAERERAAAAAKSEAQRKAEAFVRDTLNNDRLLVSGGIRLGHLCDIWRDQGGDSLTIPQAVEALGCRVERLIEYDNRRFVFAPVETAA
jgi:hypothetical protein